MDTLNPLRFGTFELDVRGGLRTGTTRVRLQDQPFEILHIMLSSAPDDVVTREQLRQRGCGLTAPMSISSTALNAAVKRLRAALGDDAENPPVRGDAAAPRLPVHRRGLNRAEVQARPGSTLSLRSARVRLAVLPFSNLSDDTVAGILQRRA